MTIEEVIKYARATAQQCQDSCQTKGSMEHHQLAEWLEELVEFRKQAVSQNLPVVDCRVMDLRDTMRPKLMCDESFKVDLLSGRKTRTTRMKAPKFIAGELFDVAVPSGVLFTAKCDRIHNGTLSPVNDKDIYREGFLSWSGFFKTLRKYYPDITGESIVWAIEFRRVNGGDAMTKRYGPKPAGGKVPVIATKEEIEAMTMTEQEAKQVIADKANEAFPVPVWTVEDFEVYEHEDGGWFCRDVLVSADGVLSVEDILPLADESKWVGYSLLEDLIENGTKIPHDRIIREQAEEIERLREAVSVRDTRSTQTHILLDGKSSTTCRYCGMPPEKCMPDCPRATHPLEGKP